MESCVAIIMVSLTAFRSLYGQERSKHSGKRYGHVNSSERSGHAEKMGHSTVVVGGQQKMAAESNVEERTISNSSTGIKSAWDREEEEIMMMERGHTRGFSREGVCLQLPECPEVTN